MSHSVQVTSTSSGQLLFNTPLNMKGLILDVDIVNGDISGIALQIQDTFTTDVGTVYNSAQTFTVNKFTAPTMAADAAFSADKNSMVKTETLGIVSVVDRNGNDSSACIITVKYDLE